MKFIFFTKTNWDEPPRIRHQLAQLLADAGHEVYFIQKPVFSLRGYSEAVKTESQIKLLRTSEILHHRLRVFRLLHKINFLGVSWSVGNLKKKNLLPSDAIIINFNYEYYFLRKIFPSNKLITIINDEFVSKALPGSQSVLAWAQKETCKKSDAVLTVSTPLAQSLSTYCMPRLFLPWADSKYQPPVKNSNRYILLFWGYINARLDFELIKIWAEQLLKDDYNEQFLFVGPISSNVKKQVQELDTYSNINFLPPSALNELPMENILAAIIPYRYGDRQIEVITISNKALQLLAHGIPLIISGMPNFIKETFVFGSERDICSLVAEIKDNFNRLQGEIADFVEKNTSEKRLEQFMNLL